MLAAPATAREHGHHQFGSPQQLSSPDGAVVQEWVVTDLKKSTAALPGYTRRGQLWEATATVRAANGTVTPIIPNLYAVSAGGQRSVVLWAVATPQGIPATTLTPGQSSTGKVYFDVVGSDPMAVIYDAGTGTPLMWCCNGSTQMQMPMENCPMCAEMKQPCPRCRDGM
ncbi:DUF1942 domain-containing protein [Mycolicibacterium arseniciresistens]|uniref:DUF1942 domain-containing protein n=1 Tax=Mycolicibacterium arseniciresistens TaxID=3062257 RepID=UPI0038993973